MQFEDFVGEVQNEARLATQGETMRAISATLETLGERLHGDEADNLGAQLPHALAAYLRLAQRKERAGGRRRRLSGRRPPCSRRSRRVAARRLPRRNGRRSRHAPG